MFVEEKTQGEPQPVKVGLPKLSEAIRIGARMRPQCFGQYFSEGRSCAIGAAYEALGGRHGDMGTHVLGSFIASNTQAGWTLQDEIVKKNDHLHWSREQIADWLESQGY